MESMLLDAAGHRRSPATMPGYHRGRPPRNKGEEYPADPPTVEEIVAVMRAVGDRPDGHRLRALIVLLWRAGLRISEALALQESDLDRGRGAVLVRRGKGGKRREVGMDRWAGSLTGGLAKRGCAARDCSDGIGAVRRDRCLLSVSTPGQSR
jgi:integrase